MTQYRFNLEINRPASNTIKKVDNYNPNLTYQTDEATFYGAILGHHSLRVYEQIQDRTLTRQQSPR